MVQRNSRSGSTHTNNGVDRNKANIEAEKGETMLTKSNTSNEKKLVAIGGKKHGSGGTPLNVPGGTTIFSDRLKITDPTILKFFNESGKKPKTFAQISKKYKLEKYQQELEDENSDKIRKTSLEKNIENANVKLSALFMFQEFDEKKGSPDEHSSQFEPFMEKMDMGYDDIFGVEKTGSENEQPSADFSDGGSFKNIPKYSLGDEVREPGASKDYPIKDRYKQAGFDRLSRLMQLSGLGKLDKKYLGNKKAMDQAAAQYQAVFAKNPELAGDYMLNRDNDPDKSDRPNAKMQKALRKLDLEPSSGESFTNADLQKAYDNGDIDNNFLAGNYQDALWSYRGGYTDIKNVSKEEMIQIQKDLTSNGIEASDGNVYLSKGDGLYEAYRVKEDGSLEQVTPDPKIIDELYQWDTTPIDDRQDPRNEDFRWDHKRALSQARKNKNNIPRLRPFNAITEPFYADQTYYNPDQAINAIQSMVQGQGQKQAMFAGPQGQLANSLAGQQFDTVVRTIGAYEDKNVAASNRESMSNTQTANQASKNLQNAINGQHDKNTVLQQEYANARTNADNNIMENEIAMWTERKDRLNLEQTIGEQFAVDPNTGIRKFVKSKDFAPTQSAETDIVNTIQDLQTKLVGFSQEDIADIAIGIHSGKYDVKRNNNAPGNANQYAQ